ncbi:MAG TPA: MMPL family transporter [Solirubrobacteraceae bacterium]|nr:MMPL family transporter [Solirubrobacteraceae bacterium]
MSLPARLLSAIAGSAARRPLLTVSVAGALGVAATVLALGLRPSAATDSFVGRSTSGYRATQRYYRAFGEEPIQIVVQGDLQKLLLGPDLDRLVGLEGCLSGNVPPAGLVHEGGAHGPCGQLARAHTVKVVVGPGTFVNEAAEEIDRQLTARYDRARHNAQSARRTIEHAALARGLSTAEAQKLGGEASKLTLERYAQEVELLGAEYGLSAPPELNDPAFVAELVFDSSAPIAGTPKQRFAYLFPSRDTALISVRTRAGLSEAQRTHTIELIRHALAMPQWHLRYGERYLLTGEPVVVSELTSSITRSLVLLLVAVMLVMALALGLVFRGRPRLLPLAIAALAVALTFGALAVVGASLTVAQVAVLPVLVGLAVDYAIQFQARFREIADESPQRSTLVIRRAAAASAPTIAAAAAAGAAALLALLLSPVPTVRGFGLLLMLGIAIAFLCALTLGSAVLALPGDLPRRPPLPRPRPRPRLESLAAAWRGARELVGHNPAIRAINRLALVHAPRHPRRLIGVGLALAALGWALDTKTQVQTNIERLVPQSMASLRNLDALERASGVGGEVDLMVSGPHLATPAVIGWMTSYQSRVLHRFGYSDTRGCGKAELCPAFSLPSLFAAGVAKPSKLTSAEVGGLLGAIPPYFSQDVITPDRRIATLAFGVRLMSLQRQQQLIEAMRAALHPPRGVSVTLVGLPVLAAQSSLAVASPWRRLLTLLVGLAAAAIVLLVAFRGDRRRALAPLLPVVLATGWSALIVFAIRVPLNPMSVTLGALVIAISTEFSVILSERWRQERLAGHPPLQALQRTYASTGAAVAASGVTAIAGFGVLVLSDIAMLRDFGVVTLVDLAASLLGVLVSLPAVLLLVGAAVGEGGAGDLHADSHREPGVRPEGGPPPRLRPHPSPR